MTFACFDKRSIKVPYKGITFDIMIRLEEEDIPIEDTLDLNAEELAQIYRDIESGNLMYFCAIVKSYYNGMELGFDSLGCCFYQSMDDFITNSGYFEDMRNTVLRQGYEKLEELYVELREFFE